MIAVTVGGWGLALCIMLTLGVVLGVLLGVDISDPFEKVGAFFLGVVILAVLFFAAYGACCWFGLVTP